MHRAVFCLGERQSNRMEIDVAVFLACGQAIASGMTVSWWCWWCAYSGSAPATLSCWLAVKQQRFPASQTRLFPFICPPETQPTLWCTFVFKGPILHLFFFFQIQICKNLFRSPEAADLIVCFQPPAATDAWQDITCVWKKTETEAGWRRQQPQNGINEVPAPSVTSSQNK